MEMDDFERDITELGIWLHRYDRHTARGHQQKIHMWQVACKWTGVVGMCICIQPAFILLYALGRVTEWLLVSHHHSHQRKDTRRPSVTRSTWRNVHEYAHHRYVNGPGDPDRVQDSFRVTRHMQRHRALKLCRLIVFALTWKWTWLWPNAFVAKCSGNAHGRCTILRLSTVLSYVDTLRFVTYFIGKPILNIAAVLCIVYGIGGRDSCTNLLLSGTLGELVASVYSFILVSPTHTGQDLTTFETSCAKGTGEYYRRQIVATTNYRTANGIGEPVHGLLADVNDFMHAWMNYHIEHHVWPNLSLYAYQAAAPRLRLLCRKHGIPYTQDSVFRRFCMTSRVILGEDSLRSEGNFGPQ